MDGASTLGGSPSKEHTNMPSRRDQTPPPPPPPPANASGDAEAEAPGTEAPPAEANTEANAEAEAPQRATVPPGPGPDVGPTALPQPAVDDKPLETPGVGGGYDYLNDRAKYARSAALPPAQSGESGE